MTQENIDIIKNGNLGFDITFPENNDMVFIFSLFDFNSDKAVQVIMDRESDLRISKQSKEDAFNWTHKFLCLLPEKTSFKIKLLSTRLIKFSIYKNQNIIACTFSDNFISLLNVGSAPTLEHQEGALNTLIKFL